MNRSNGPRGLHDPLSFSNNINFNTYKVKKYLHFDKRINIADDKHMQNNIQDAAWISSYAFLPYIHFKIEFEKYSKVPSEEGHHIKKKIREIYYAAHKDSYIYKYYGDLLNDKYNEYAIDNRIDDIAVAYRNNKKGQNNIHFAFEVFDFLLKQESAIIIALDFTSFFDKINHQSLKSKMQRVLQVDELPEDWYKVYRSITRYAYIEKDEVDNFLLNTYGKEKLRRVRCKLPQIMNTKEFRIFKKGKVKVNKSREGIPQGSGISAVCSNVHLIDFDRAILEWCKNHHPDTLYRRYCDDLIIVIPFENPNEGNLESIKSEILNKVEVYEEDGLIIQEKKTELRFYKNEEIFNENGEESSLDYLGFVLRNKQIRIREKSLFKYYYRAYRKAKVSKKIAKKTNRPGPKKDLYNLYTHLGHRYMGYGNFNAYAKKAHEVMKGLPYKSQIKKQVKNHWTRIHKKLE